MRAETLLAGEFSADAALAALTAPRTVGAAQGAAQLSRAGTPGAPKVGVPGIVPGAPGGARTAGADVADAAPRVAAEAKAAAAQEAASKKAAADQAKAEKAAAANAAKQAAAQEAAEAKAAIAPEAVPVLLGMPAGLQRYP